MDSGIRIIIIAAVSENNVIGRDGEIPWRLSEDLKRFSKLTSGNIVIAGRKTHESIMHRLGHPLPDRRTIVVTRQEDYQAEGVIVAHSFEGALDKAKEHQKENQKVFVIGGSEVYKVALLVANMIYIT